MNKDKYVICTYDKVITVITGNFKEVMKTATAIAHFEYPTEILVCKVVCNAQEV